MKITVSIDDVNPQKGWRILGDETEKWFRELNETFGVRFTLFIPSNYHRQWAISDHKEWIRELDSIDYFELAAHGHYHQTNAPELFGECEWLGFDLKYDTDINSREGNTAIQLSSYDRSNMMIDEWLKCGITPKGFRPPGWLIHPLTKRRLELFFEYVAIHYEHNNGLEWKCETFFGHDGINESNVSLHNENMIMFQSHIAGDWNDNMWNTENYLNLRNWMKYFCDSGKIFECKTLSECLDES